MNHDVIVTEIVNVYYREHSNWMRRESIPRTFNAVALMVQGEIEYQFSNKTLVVKKGDLLFLPGNVAYAGKKRTETVAYFVVDFLCQTEDEFKDFAAPCVIGAANYDKYISEFSHAVDLWKNHMADVNIKIKALLYSAMGEIYGREQVEKKNTRAAEIISYITDHIGDAQMTVTELCRIFFISESQLRRNLYKATGLSPNEYIFTLRMNKAKGMLTYTTHPVKYIAAECGFSSTYYFSRRFSGNTGMSPVKYRALTRNG
jgi:AraC-like DNA-binding protein